jgi:uncharacterized protein YndB with AHSA1/START domain
MDNLPAEISTLRVFQEIQISASPSIVFETIIANSKDFAPDGTVLNLKFEPWPGGRWYRDLGNNTGHLWGHVQVIKPPTLLEIVGPMFMSHPVASHLQYRLTEKAGGTLLTLNHRAFGEIDPQHREGVTQGWGKVLAQIKQKSEK